MKRSERFLKSIRDAKRVGIVTHSFPDPDAMAAGWGLKLLVETATHIPCRVLAGGNVFHAENLKFIELLAPPLKLTDAYVPGANEAVVFVDCQPTNGNHLLVDSAVTANAVIDHHPPAKRRYRCRFRDIRPRAASCSTIVANYLQEQGIRPSAKLATALFTGLNTDIARQPILTEADQRAVRFLAQDADFNLVLSIQYAPYPRQIFRRFCSSLQAARMIGHTAVCFAPEIDSPAGMANMADMIIRCDDVQAVLAVGVKGSNCFITVRCRSTHRRAGELAAALADGMGSGGGHADRAAGQIPITAERDIHYIQNKLLRRWREIFDLADAPARPFLEC